VESEQPFTGLEKQIEEVGKEAWRIAKAPKSFRAVPAATLQRPREQNSLGATRTRPAWVLDAQDPCSRTSSTTSSRSSRAHNPSERYPATQRAAIGGGDALGPYKSHPRNSPSHAPAGRRQPRAHTKMSRPAGRATPRRSERDFVFGCSQKLDATPIVPHLDASHLPSVAKLGEQPGFQTTTRACANLGERPRRTCLDLLVPRVADW